MLHPSSAQSSAALLRQPVGFGAHAVPPPTYHPSLAHSPPHHYPAEPHASKKKSSKGKEKEKSKEKSNHASRKGKERDKGTPIQPAPAPSPYPVSQPHPGAPQQRTAFRVRAYTNDPSATGTPPSIQEGPYGAAYRVGAGEDGRSRSHANRQHAQTAPGATDTQPRPSYYRYDYDKIRDSAPANRAKQQAAGIPIPSTSPYAPPPPSHRVAPPQQLYPHHSSSPVPTSSSRPHGSSSSSRSSKRKDTHMYPTDNIYPSPQPSYSDTYDWSQDTYFSPAPAPDPNHYAPTPVPVYEASPPPAPAPPPRKEKRHKSRSHRHHEPPPQQYPPLDSGYAPAPVQTQPPIPQPPTRVVRILTLLIEDKRQYHDEENENLLTEVRVPLRPADPGDTGMWADAQEVSEELQKGPSRIDGRAKVYTLRGKYKQYFLRTSEDGTHVCQPANLKVTPERTLEIFIEDNPLPAGQYYAHHSLRTPSSPPRDLPTPSTDRRSMTIPSPSPAPASVSSSLQLQIGIPGPTPPAEKRPSHSSLFSGDDDFQAPSPEEFKYDAPSSSKKRPRSSSAQSVQSVRSATPQHQPLDDAFSPFEHREPSEMPVSAVQSRTSSVASQPSQPRAPQPFPAPPPLYDPAPVSPVSPFEFSDTTTPQAAQTRVPSAQHSRSPSTSSFSQTAPSPAPSRAPSGSKPSPTKKAKLDRLGVPQVQPPHESQAHTEYSVSPASTSRPPAFPFSDTRTTPRVVSGFEAYANKPPPVAFSGPPPAPAPAAPNPFARYRGDDAASSLPSFSFSASQSQPKPSPITIPTVPMKPTFSPPSSPLLANTSPQPSMPTTMAPTALTITPTLSGEASSELDNAVGKYIRGIIVDEPAWKTFVANRSRVLPMRAQLTQYRYVAGVVARFAGSTTPVDLPGAAGVCVSQGQVVKAFNLKREWWEECEEILGLAGMYGEGGSRGQDPRVVGMLDEEPPITTGMQAKKFLKVLREVHAQWTMKRDG
ncbi:hypothetical protein GSI_03640 [Ganoderma sinense ZZ0214-1]|uniref:Uncharacterized protein n=1 Tax=Ganoderma sinense ZZ0214-1 TaxID=1077348 RepID=A0A2G8SJJ0_9APHY|nr:hypothetical protein GSI_03640 [Ganoderma sinense ZZ0214-1]